ncbi:MAG: HD domain-containing protein [Candidatus Sungbacteria bacterium]|nr:HD domain-containing protein [Candidatus Sungbacteria bacterium]
MNSIDIKDPVHKTIAVSPEEREILDHPYVQRLRFIRQLGFVPLVYPSATHDRLSHSLGAMHACGLLARQLFCNDAYSVLARLLAPEEKKFLLRIIRLAGLLHDIGHAPFSHTAEKAMPKIRELALPAALLKYPNEQRPAVHEDYSVLLILGLAEEPNKVLGQEEAEIIASLVHHKKIRIPPSWKHHFSPALNTESLHAIARAVVSSDLDGDRMDYLLRDSHFAGVPYGQFDMPWLISNLGVILLGDRYVMSISESGVHAFEHYLLCRYNMYTQVYMHKTSKCFEYYFQQSLACRELSYVIPGKRDQYVLLRDATLTEQLARASEHEPRSWASRLMRRQAAYRVARLWNNEEEINATFRCLIKDLAPYIITPFLSLSKSRFLEMQHIEAPASPQSRTSASLFTGLATVPIMVVHRQFGITSAASLADYSFILKRYHPDIVIGDLYILRDEYEQHSATIRNIMRPYRAFGSSEVQLEDLG